MDREPTEAELLNTGQPGNVSGKPIADDVLIDTHGTDEDREPVDEAQRDDVWANAVVTEHDPER